MRNPTSLQEQAIALTSELDLAHAATVRRVREQAQNIASTPEGLALLERFNNGERRAALAGMDALAIVETLKLAAMKRSVAEVASNAVLRRDDEGGDGGETYPPR